MNTNGRSVGEIFKFRKALLKRRRSSIERRNVEWELTLEFGRERELPALIRWLVYCGGYPDNCGNVCIQSLCPSFEQYPANHTYHNYYYSRGLGWGELHVIHPNSLVHRYFQLIKWPIYGDWVHSTTAGNWTFRWHPNDVMTVRLIFVFIFFRWLRNLLSPSFLPSIIQFISHYVRDSDHVCLFYNSIDIFSWKWDDYIANRSSHCSISVSL